MVVGILLVFEGQSTVAYMIEVLKPLEVGDCDTTSITVQVWDDECFLSLEDLICFRSDWTVGTLSNYLNFPISHNIVLIKKYFDV